MHRQLAEAALVAAAVAAAVSFAGCTKPFQTQRGALSPVADANQKPLAGPTKVAVDGSALALGQPEQSAEQRRQDLDQFGRLVGDGRLAAARQWIERHPDLALDALRDANGGTLSPKLLHTMAQYYGELLAAPPAVSWQQCLQARGQNEPTFAAYYEARRQATVQMGAGEFSAATAIDVSAAAQRTGQTLLSIDAAQLMGVNQMLADRPTEAVKWLDQAVQLAHGAAPHQTAHLLLLLSEARRRAGDVAGTNQAWSNSVEVAGGLLARPQAVTDPTYWERALYLHPVGFDWPPALHGSLAALARSSRLPEVLQPVLCSFGGPPQSSAEATIWGCLAYWRLDRSEPQAALIAFKRVESLCPTGEVAAWSRLGQARALTALDQTPAATALLMQQAGQDEQSPAARAALAELGSIRVRAGMTLQGITLLRQALEVGTPSEWPGRASAEADLGLALLLVGDERGGLTWLARAREHFQARGDLESVAQSLWNETRYFEQAKNKERCAALDKQYRAMQF